MTPSVLSVAEIFMGSVTALFPYCDILIFGWTIPNIGVKRLITKQEASHPGGTKTNISFSLRGHNSYSDSHRVDFTESRRLRAPGLTEEHSQNRSSAPHPTNLQIPVCVAKYSRDQCQPHFMSDWWTQLRHVGDYHILSYSQPQGPCFTVIRQTGCIRGTHMAFYSSLHTQSWNTSNSASATSFHIRTRLKNEFWSIYNNSVHINHGTNVNWAGTPEKVNINILPVVAIASVIITGWNLQEHLSSEALINGTEETFVSLTGENVSCVAKRTDLVSAIVRRPHWFHQLVTSMPIRVSNMDYVMNYTLFRKKAKLDLSVWFCLSDGYGCHDNVIQTNIKLKTHVFFTKTKVGLMFNLAKRVFLQ